MWAPSSEFVSSSMPSWQILTAHAQPFRGARDLAFCLKVPLDSLLVWASSEGSGETARMRRLAWTIAARIGDKYKIHLMRSMFSLEKKGLVVVRWTCSKVVYTYTWVTTTDNVHPTGALNSVSSQCARGKSSVAHVVNRLLRENRKTILKFLSGKKAFQKRNPPDLKFYPSKLTDKYFPHMV